MYNINYRKLESAVVEHHKDVCKAMDRTDEKEPDTVILTIFDEQPCDAHNRPLVRLKMECNSCGASGIMDILYEECKHISTPDLKKQDERYSNRMGGINISEKYKE